MPLELPLRPRVRLPDTLPEWEVPSAPRRGRGGIFGLSFTGYAAVVAVCIGLSSGALSLRPPSGSTPGPAPFERPTVAAAVATAPSETPRSETPPPTAPAASTSVGSSVEPTPAWSPPLPSCEEAARTYKDDLTEGSTALPRDMTGSAYGALLDGPATQLLLTSCAARRWRHVDVCVAVRGFRAVGATVETDPQDGAVERCIANTIAGLSFSHQPVLKLIRSELSLLPKR
jgi:hypothetical protein